MVDMGYTQLYLLFGFVGSCASICPWRWYWNGVYVPIFLSRSRVTFISLARAVPVLRRGGYFIVVRKTGGFVSHSGSVMEHGR